MRLRVVAKCPSRRWIELYGDEAGRPSTVRARREQSAHTGDITDLDSGIDQLAATATGEERHWGDAD